MADERNVLYRLQLDNASVLGALDEIIARFEKMEETGGRVIRQLGQELSSISNVTAALVQAQTSLTGATRQQGESMDQAAKATRRVNDERKESARLNKEVGDATKDEAAAIAAAIEQETQARKRAAVESSLQKRQLREVSVELSKNSSEVLRLIKLFPEVEQEIRKIVDQNGSFTATLGTSRKALTDQEQEVRDLIQLYPQLAAEIQRVAESTRLGQQEGISIRATPTQFKAGPGINDAAFEAESRTTAARAAELQREAVQRLREEKQREERVTRENNRQLAQNTAEVYRLIKLFPGAEHGIRALTDKYGTFTVRVGANAKALTEEERKVHDLIKAYPQLEREINRLANANPLSKSQGIAVQATPTKFRSEQETSFLNPFEIRQVAQALDQLGLRGASTAGQLFSVFGPVGLAIAGIGLSVAAVTKALIEMGRAGVKAFVDLVKESKEIATAADSVEASFSGLFGDENVGQAVFEAVRLESERLGVNMDEIVRKSLPFVRSVEEALKLGEFAVGLGQLDPKQGVKGATRVLQDALVGNLQPLRKTFAINTEEIAEAQERLGDVAGLLVGLEAVLEGRGLDFETLSGTMIVAGGQMEQILQSLKEQLGEPIVDTLIEQFNALFKLTQDNRDDLLIAANGIGEAVAGVLEFFLEGVQGFLEDLDEEKALRFADSVVMIGEAIEGVMRVVIGGDITTGIDSIVSGVERIAATGEKLIQVTGAIKAVYAVLSNAPDFDVLKPYREAIRISAEESRPFLEVLNEQIAIHQDLGAAMDAFNEVTEQTAEEILAYRKRTEESTAANHEFADSLDESKQALLDLANTQTALDYDTEAAEDAEKALIEFQEESAGITEKYNEDREKAERDLNDKLEDADKKRNRDLIDLEEELSEKRIDAAKDNQEAIDDIIRKNRLAIRDAYIDASDKEADILRKNIRRVEEIEKESTKERIKIERDFQNELAKMRRKYEFDKQEAIRANDAIEFLRIKRRFEFELNESRLERDKEVTEQDDSAEDKREKARLQLEQEIEDAQIANQRKLRDLQQRLSDELEAQRIKHQRELEEIAVFEARKREEIDKAYKRSVEDIRTTFDRRLRELQIAYDKEIALVRAKEAELTAILQQAKAAQAQSLAAYNAAVAASGGISLSGGIGGRRGSPGGRRAPEPAPDDVPSADFPSFVGSGGTSGLPIPAGAEGLTGRAGGGFVRARTPVMVGEPIAGKPNPEIIAPSTDSFVLPLRKLMFSPPRSYNSFMSGSGGGKAEVAIDMIDPTKISPEVRYQIMQMISEVVAKGMEKARYHG